MYSWSRFICGNICSVHSFGLDEWFVGGGVLGKSLNALVVGYVLWSLIQNTISQMGTTVMNNAKSGILEQQYLMPISSKRLFLNKSIDFRLSF